MGVDWRVPNADGVVGRNSIPDSPDSYLEGNWVDSNLLLALLAVAIAVLFVRRRQVLAVVKQNWAILFFFLYCLASVAWSDFPFVAFKRSTEKNLSGT